MATQFVPVLFKVVNANGSRAYRNPYLLTSALLKQGRWGQSQAIMDYAPTVNQNIFIAPRLDGTPILCFDDAAAAFDFADAHSGRVVYEAVGVGEVIAVTRVLKLRRGWADHAVAFWKAVREGQDVRKYSLSRKAPDNTVALFGHIRLVQRATRPVVTPVAVPNLEPVSEAGSDDGDDTAGQTEPGRTN